MTLTSERAPAVLWQHRRAALNHDWLKNHYLLALGALINVLDEFVDNPNLPCRYITTTLPEWEAKRIELNQLLNEFPDTMSPRSLFSVWPLVNLPENDRASLGALVDTLWRERHPIEKWIGDVHHAIGRVECAYQDLSADLSRAPGNDLLAVRQFRSRFDVFRRACIGLARAIEALPGTVQVL